MLRNALLRLRRARPRCSDHQLRGVSSPCHGSGLHLSKLGPTTASHTAALCPKPKPRTGHVLPSPPPPPGSACQPAPTALRSPTRPGLANFSLWRSRGWPGSDGGHRAGVAAAAGLRGAGLRGRGPPGGAEVRGVRAGAVRLRVLPGDGGARLREVPRPGGPIAYADCRLIRWMRRVLQLRCQL